MFLVAMILYVVEAVLKLIGLGFSQYLRAARRRFEFGIACASLVLLVLQPFFTLDQYVQLVLAISVIRIIQYSPALNQLVYQLYVALPTIIAVVVRLLNGNRSLQTFK